MTGSFITTMWSFDFLLDTQVVAEELRGIVVSHRRTNAVLISFITLFMIMVNSAIATTRR